MKNLFHHHHQIFYEHAGTGAMSTSVGPLPGSWLAACMADLTPDLQVSFCDYKIGHGSMLCVKDHDQFK